MADWPGAGDAALDALLALAEARNRELTQAAWRLKLAHLAAAQQQLRFTPSAGGGVNLSAPLDPPRHLDRSGQLNLAVGWEADLWGRLGAEQSAAAAQQRAAQGEVRTAMLSLRGRVAAWPRCTGSWRRPGNWSRWPGSSKPWRANCWKPPPAGA